jgi:hypothetical protein
VCPGMLAIPLQPDSRLCSRTHHVAHQPQELLILLPSAPSHWHRSQPLAALRPSRAPLPKPPVPSLTSPGIDGFNQESAALLPSSPAPSSQPSCACLVMPSGRCGPAAAASGSVSRWSSPLYRWGGRWGSTQQQEDTLWQQAALWRSLCSRQQPGSDVAAAGAGGHTVAAGSAGAEQ